MIVRIGWQCNIFLFCKMIFFSSSKKSLSLSFVCIMWTRKLEEAEQGSRYMVSKLNILITLHKRTQAKTTYEKEFNVDGSSLWMLWCDGFQLSFAKSDLLQCVNTLYENVYNSINIRNITMLYYEKYYIYKGFAFLCILAKLILYHSCVYGIGIRFTLHAWGNNNSRLVVYDSLFNECYLTILNRVFNVKFCISCQEKCKLWQN